MPTPSASLRAGLTSVGVTWSGQGIGRVLTYRPLDGGPVIRFAVRSRVDLRREQAIVEEALRGHDEMPMNRAAYPSNWNQISAAIRTRAGDKCEWPGCGVPNGWLIVWEGERWHKMTGTGDAEGLDGIKVVRIVLTVAHVDHDTTNNDPANLRAWCQRHHNRWDMPMRQEHASETRRRRRVEQGQLAMALEA